VTARLTLGWSAAAVGALCVGLVYKPPLRFVYNASDSAPRGLYAVVPATQLKVGDYVVARLPENAAKLADARHYLPRSLPVLKLIAAMVGQQVCVRGGTVYIDQTAVARALQSDGRDRALDAWNHCRRLQRDEVFLLNPGHPASFDSRYFGPIDVTFVRGRAVPIWTTSRQ